MRWLAVGLLLVVGACSTGPEEPQPSIIGQWRLVTVRDHALPVSAVIGDEVMLITGSSFEARSDKRWLALMEVWQPDSHLSPLEFFGSWTQAGDRVSLVQDEGCTDVGTVTGDTFRIPVDCDFGLDLGFRRTRFPSAPTP